MAFELTMVGEKGDGQRFAFSLPVVRLGRSSANELVINDASASRHHCEISEVDGKHTLRDLGSSNGTKVNDKLATETDLNEGDRISIGTVVLEFHKASQARPSSRSEVGVAPSEPRARERLREAHTTGFTPPAAFRSGSSRTPVFPRRKKQARLVEKKTWYELPWVRRAIVGGIVAVGLVAAVLVALGHGSREDRSREVFAADSDNAQLRFGAGKVDVYTPDKANFEFLFQNGHVTVTYAVGGIETRDELAVAVNGTTVGYASLSPNAWTRGLTLELPRHVLRPGVNILTFDNTLSPPREERWGVSQVMISEKPLPPPDNKRASQLYELGKAAYEARAVTPANLWRAIEYLTEAREFLEGLVDPPPLFKDISELEDRAKGELKAVFDAHNFAAEKARRLGNNQEAVQSLQDVLRYFPDAKDPRHVQAKARLSEMGQPGVE